MQKKLTLNIDEKLIEYAHDLSKETNKSIFRLFEEYLLTLKNQKSNIDLSPRINDLYGIFEDNPIPDKKESRKIFHDKSIVGS